MVKASMIHHMNVTIDDVDKAREFYGQVLGLPEIKRPNVGGRGCGSGVRPMSFTSRCSQASRAVAPA